MFIALQEGTAPGMPILPFGEYQEGSTVFLPFQASRLYKLEVTADGSRCTVRVWDRTFWRDPAEPHEVCSIAATEHALHASISTPISASVTFAVYLKHFPENGGWGRMLSDWEHGIRGGDGDALISRCFHLDAHQEGGAKLRPLPERPRIYQLLPRLFSNINETRKPNGMASENGVGKFAQITDAALTAIRSMGFTHVWLTGVLQQATASTYPELGEPADDPDLLKGIAGSPYAIKDYFDVCPDYAIDPLQRLAEFKQLIDRAHACGLKILIDFVPNHVARSYRSDVRPPATFGLNDDRTTFFHPSNHFFYLRPSDPGGGPPLALPTLVDGIPISPTCTVLGTCTGNYSGEMDHGRVTGNNGVTWAPSIYDWYETVKLNYGYDFTTGAREYPCGSSPETPIPGLWPKMDEILRYWQEIGVDGFRCDMAHMVPPEFWSWAISEARKRNQTVYFIAEAYDSDPAKVCSGDPILNAMNHGRGHVMIDLLGAGFDAVYDDPTYKVLKSIYDGSGWANDLDSLFPHSFVFHRSLRYAENHDEVRLAAAGHWGGTAGRAGIAICAILYGLGRGPLLLYHGQEVAEPASGAEGFGGDNGRTTIFDYWSMPELAKWVNDHQYDGGRLAPEQKALRAAYSQLVDLTSRPAFREGECFPLNPTNLWNDAYGRLPGENASGHWFYAFIRSTGPGGEHCLVISNLHPSQPLRDVRIFLSPEADAYMALEGAVTLMDQLCITPPLRIETSSEIIRTRGIQISEIPPLTAYFLAIKKNDDSVATAF